jgi:glycosyltransferase involved in cell wall biosynthesis
MVVKLMRIGIDGNLLCGKKTGMGTVVYHVLKNYINKDENIDIILYVPQKLEDSYMNVLMRNNITVTVLKSSNYMIWEQITLRKQIKKDKIDVFWFPYNTATINPTCKSVVTINDVIFMKNPLFAPPTIYKKLGQLYRKIFVPIAASKAQKIITISEYASNEIRSVFPQSSDKIKIVYLSAESGETKLDINQWKKFKVKKNITNDYILGFGSIERRKNSLELIKAYELLPEEYKKQYQLVLFGFRGWEKSLEFDYVNLHHIKGVIFLDYVSEQEKCNLYENSKMFVFPSLSEGFGLPILEAFASETPVITSNTTSLPEVAGNAAILVNPEDRIAIKDAIKKLLEDKFLIDKLIQAGKHQYEKFNWKITAEKIFRILYEIE